MNKLKNSAFKMLPLMLVALIILGSVVFVSFQPKAVPNKVDVQPSKLKYDNVGGLSVSENIIETSEQGYNNNKKDDKNKNNDGEAPTQSATEKNNNEHNSDVGNSNNQNNNSTPNTEIDSTTKEIAETSNDNKKSDINTPQKEKATSPQTENVAYFTTSIKDGEKVKKSDYHFTITHLKKELKLKSLTVYVNDKKVSQFNGNVQFENGKNTIYISVSYTDKNSKLISVYKQYTVYAELGEIEIITSLSNFTTLEKSVSFSAYAQLNGESVAVDVYCNDKIIKAESKNNYKVTLKNGENIIEIKAQSKTQKYKVICNATNEVSIYTTLENTTVSYEEYSFTAYLINGENSSFSVIVNGSAILGDRDYNIKLNVGNNTVRLKATYTDNGESKTINQSYTIKYVPKADEHTAPKLEYSNVSDGMSVKGNMFTLNIKPTDYNGNRIYDNNIKVVLNNIPYSSAWVNEYTSYILYLVNGVNNLSIRITDNEGRYTDYYYDINCTNVSDGEKIGTVTVSIDAIVLGKGYIISPLQADIIQGENPAQLIDRILNENGFTYSNMGTLQQGFYLSRISKEGIGNGVSIPIELVNEINNDGLSWNTQKYADSIGEHDYCQGAGFMYSINDNFPGVSLSEAVLQDGDTFKIRFTLAYGKDIGGYASDTTQNYEVIW